MNYKNIDYIKIYKDATRNIFDPNYNDLLPIKDELFMIIDKTFILENHKLFLFMRDTIALLFKLKEDNRLSILSSETIDIAICFLPFAKHHELSKLLNVLLYPNEVLDNDKENYYSVMKEVFDRMHMISSVEGIDKIKRTFLAIIFDIIEIERNTWKYQVRNSEIRRVYNDVGLKALAYYYANKEEFNINSLKELIDGILFNRNGICDYCLMNGFYTNKPIHNYDEDTELINHLFQKIEKENNKRLIK